MCNLTYNPKEFVCMICVGYEKTIFRGDNKKVKVREREEKEVSGNEKEI